MVRLAEVHEYVQHVTFPATKEEIIQQVRDREVSDAVIERLNVLPEHRYGSTDAVIDALRGVE